MLKEREGKQATPTLVLPKPKSSLSLQNVGKEKHT